MDDEERAAKAARAKAMLKKRQQQKKSGVAPSSSGVNTPSPPVSRAVTPAPSHARDSVGIINVTGALEPPPSAHESSDVTGNSKPGPVDTSAARDVDAREKEQHDEEIPRMLQDKQQTISLLVSEKAALVEALKGFEGVHSKLQSKEAELEGKLQEFHEQQVDFIRVKGERSAFSTQLQDLDQQNTHLASKLREQERELLSSRNETEKLRSELHEKERRTRELEEQIQNDDRVELLETKLKNTQDRAEEVSFQLSKLKQSHDKLKNDHKELQKDLGSKMTTGEELQKNIATLGDKLRSSEDELSVIASERDTLAAANDTLTSQLQASEQSVVELELKFSQAVSDLSAVTRQFETSQVELRTTLERAEDAEKAQHDLQEEGSGLMRSLDEMRPKIVELTGAKLELTEETDRLTRALDQRDATIADLEIQLGDTQNALSDARRDRDLLAKEQEKQKFASETNISELQRAYGELQTQLDDTFASARELEADRSEQRQTAVRLQEEIDSLRTAQQGHSDEVASLQSRLRESQKAEEEGQSLLHELQLEVEAFRTEIEALQAEIGSKEDEISRLQQAASLSPSPAPRSLNDEVQSALKQQYGLELSTAQSTIRNLEADVYDAEARFRSLQMQAANMEDEIVRLRTVAKAQRPHIHHSRDSTSARRSDDLRRTSFASQSSDSVSRFPPSAFIDENLPPATRHQRHVSLAMLQARTQTAQRPQFLDESHIFWCASCKGDLIVL